MIKQNVFFTPLYFFYSFLRNIYPNPCNCMKTNKVSFYKNENIYPNAKTFIQMPKHLSKNTLFTPYIYPSQETFIHLDLSFFTWINKKKGYKSNIIY